MLNLVFGQIHYKKSKLRIFGTIRPNLLPVEVHASYDSFRLDKWCNVKCEILKICPVHFQIILTKILFSEEQYLYWKELIFEESVPDLECAIVVYLKLLEFLYVECSNVSHEVLIYCYVPEPLKSVTRNLILNMSETDIMLKFLSGHD